VTDIEGSYHRRRGRDLIARHGETVFNAAHRIQGAVLHTPLTRAGIAQADEIGLALRIALGERPALTLWASPTGRTLQTLAIITERLGLDWHAVRTDERLVEIGVGAWDGRYYPDVEAEIGPVWTQDGLLRPAPDGEDYRAIAARLSGWLADTADDAADRLVVTHGMTGRVLRGLLIGSPDHPQMAAPIAPGLPQGSIVAVADGRETLLHRGAGR
jgi:probable phosphoglycerate mutase